MESAVLVNDLTKWYPGKKNSPALKQINFSVNKGELFGLVGPDGAGKTTMLRIIATVMFPSLGTVNLEGKDTQKHTSQVRDLVGYMPQNFSLYPDLSVLENLQFFSRINNVLPADEKRQIEKMLALTNLAPFTARKAGKLSGGMKKKLALSCALINDPEILLLDEPSTGVDPISRKELWTMLSQVVEHGVSIIASTPYMDEAEKCHKIGVLYEGELLVTDSPLKLIDDFPYPIVEFLASSRKWSRKIVAELDGVKDWRPVGDKIRIMVLKDPDSMKKQIKKAFEKSPAELVSLRISRPHMEDVFMQKVLQKRGTNE